MSERAARCDYAGCPYPEFSPEQVYTTIRIEPDGEVLTEAVELHLHPECVPCIFEGAPEGEQ